MHVTRLARIAAFALAALVCGPVAAESAGSGVYPRPTLIDGPDGRKVYGGWTQVEDHEWVADPDDPASPRFFEIQNSPAEPEAALREIARRAGLDISDAATREIETWPIVAGGKGYATAASARVEGVAHSIFVTTIYREEGRYDTDLHSIPTDSYRAWGGVMFYLDMMEVTNGDEGLPEGFREEARVAGNADQAEVFAGLIDVKVARTAATIRQAYSGALETMQRLNRRLQDSADCHMLSYCDYDWMTGQTDYNGD